MAGEAGSPELRASLLSDEDMTQRASRLPFRIGSGRFVLASSIVTGLVLLGCALAGRSSMKSSLDLGGKAGHLPVMLPELVWNSPSHPTPFFRIAAAGPRDAGLQHGRVARERIRAWFASAEMRSVFEWASGTGATAFAKLKHDNEVEFPDFAEEIQGIAEAAGVPLDHVWCVNMLMELEMLMANTGNRAKHCSDEYVVSHEGYAAGFAHGHNDDWSPVAKRYWYFLAVKALPGASGVYDCAGVTYPGTLVGWSPTWNAHGIFSTQNTLTPRSTRPSGLACNLVQRRAICPAKSLSEAIAGLTIRGWSDGASMNVVDLRGRRMANIELWEDRHSVLEVTPAMGNYSHFNEYKHLTAARGAPIDNPRDFVRDPRQAVVDALPPPRSDRDIMTRLSNPKVFSKAGTLVTTVLNGTTGQLRIWCCGISPATQPDSPVYSLDLLHFF